MAVALDCGMDRDDARWAEVVDDITTALSVSEQCVRERYSTLLEMGLTRPRDEPDWWCRRDDDWLNEID